MTGWQFLKRLNIKALVIMVGLAVVVGLSGNALPAAALSSSSNSTISTASSSARDCDSNAVVYCGALTPNELQSKYAGNSSIADIYNCFNISSADINNLQTTSQMGTVDRSGNVMLNGKVVAINAMTAGWQYIPGSTATNCGNTAFYERPPSVSFVSNQLSAFVVMTNGRFDYAILTSCGNPIEAAPTTSAPAPTAPAVQQTTPPPTTPAPIETVQVTKPAPQPPKQLVNTGPTDVVMVFLGASFAAAALHRIYQKRKLFKS